MASNTKVETESKEQMDFEKAKAAFEAEKAAFEKKIAELEAEAAAKLAEEEAKAARENDPEARVDIFIDKPTNVHDDPNLFVSVNGRNFLLPKGKTSSVPRYIYDEIIRSRLAEAHLVETMNELKAKAQQPAAM